MPITKQDFEKVCKAIETTHKGMHALCSELGVSFDLFRKELDNPESYQRYTRAREAQLNYLEEELLSLAWDIENINLVDQKVNLGNNYIQQARLKYDAVKFVLSKLRTHVWGDKIEVTTKEEPRIFKID